MKKLMVLLLCLGLLLSCAACGSSGGPEAAPADRVPLAATPPAERAAAKAARRPSG